MKTSGKHAGIVGVGPSPGNMSQNDPKTTSLMMSIPKNPQPPTKKFFRMQSRRVAYLFEPLKSSLVQLGGELWRW